MRLIFMGTPDFAVPTLELLAKTHDIVAVYTRLPKPKGRGLEVLKTPVHIAAEALNTPVFTPKNFKDEADIESFKAHKADAAIVVAYGLILPLAILNAPKHGCFNLHGSLLPRWRGAAPIHRAVMACDSETGVMVMKMDIGLDTGDVALTFKMPINPQNTTQDLHDRLKISGASLMNEAIDLLEQGKLNFTKQSEEGVTYATKIDKSESKIDFNKPKKEVLAHIHGLSPFPGSWTEQDGVRIKVLKAEIFDKKLDALTFPCKDGFIRALEVQKAGGKPMKTEEYLRGIK